MTGLIAGLAIGALGVCPAYDVTLLDSGACWKCRAQVRPLSVADNVAWGSR